jgi:hypothetical protein
MMFVSDATAPPLAVRCHAEGGVATGGAAPVTGQPMTMHGPPPGFFADKPQQPHTTQRIHPIILLSMAPADFKIQNLFTQTVPKPITAMFFDLGK